MKIFFTSDTFFGRKSTAIERGFKNDEEMLDSYIDTWNKRVGKNDVVYHLGNFGWDPISTEGAMIHLNGKIMFISGPFDSHLLEMSLVKIGRHQVLTNQIAILPKERVILSHWPLLDWPGKNEEVIHVHGGEIPSETSKGHRFNANVSNWNGGPIDLEFIQDIIQSQKEN